MVSPLPPLPPPFSPSITADHHPLSSSLYPMFGEKPKRLCQEGEGEEKTGDRKGGLLAPSARTSVGRVDQIGMLLPDMRETPVSYSLRIPECHRLFLNHSSAHRFSRPSVFSVSREPGGDKVTKRRREGLKGVALFSEALWHR